MGWGETRALTGWVPGCVGVAALVGTLHAAALDVIANRAQGAAALLDALPWPLPPAHPVTPLTHTLVYSQSPTHTRTRAARAQTRTAKAVPMAATASGAYAPFVFVDVVQVRGPERLAPPPALPV
jgi:hypothetical protein